MTVEKCSVHNCKRQNLSFHVTQIIYFYAFFDLFENQHEFDLGYLLDDWPPVVIIKTDQTSEFCEF